MSLEERVVRIAGIILLIVILAGILNYARLWGIDTPVHFFEDGSFVFGPWNGCLPWGLCAIN